MGDREKPGWWDAAQVKRERESLERMMRQRCLNKSDAEFECPHGALPHDRNKVCGCWTAEAELALEHRVPENPDYSDAA